MNPQALFKVSYGVYIVSSSLHGKLNGQIANTVFQTASEPQIITICINKQNLTHEYIKESGKFSVSILAKETPMKFIGKFGFKSGRDIDKFSDTQYKLGSTGSPIVLENAVGYLEAEVVSSADSVTHTLFIGKIIEAEITSDAEPMTYAYYHQVKQGLSPKSAPTYIKEGTK